MDKQDQIVSQVPNFVGKLLQKMAAVEIVTVSVPKVSAYTCTISEPWLKVVLRKRQFPQLTKMVWPSEAVKAIIGTPSSVPSLHGYAWPMLPLLMLTHNWSLPRRFKSSINSSISIGAKS